MRRVECPNCRLVISSPGPPRRCPRCLIGAEGRFELLDRLAPVEFQQAVAWTQSRVIRVVGELDAANCPRLAQLLDRSAWGQPPCVVLDLSGCEFLDATALAAIADARKRLAARGRELLVSGARGQVARLLALGAAICPEAALQRSRPAEKVRSPPLRGLSLQHSGGRSNAEAGRQIKRIR